MFRILIVEDQQNKSKKILASFKKIGLVAAQIDLCKNLQDAREKLAEITYDLLLLDISLPRMPEEDPTPKAGADLLNELVNRDNLRKPATVVGITAYRELKVELEADFARHLWTLLYADPTTDEWVDRIQELGAYLVKAKESELKTHYTTDLCVVSALHDPELKAVLRLPWKWSGPQVLDPGAFYYRGEVMAGSKNLSVVAASIGKAGMVAAAISCMKLITAFRPRFLAMTGICAGMKDDCELGDVVLASLAWEWQSGKSVVNEGQQKHLIEPHQLSVPTFVTSKFEILKMESGLWDGIRDRWPAEKPTTPLRLHIGPISTGSLVAGDGMLLTKAAEQHRKMIGLDMEIYGVYSAAFYGPYPKPTAFALKSVADFGDEDKDDKWQPYASYTSAAALDAFVKSYLPSLLSLAGQQ